MRTVWRGIRGAKQERPDGLYVLEAGPLMRANQKRLVGFALKSRLPSMHTSRGRDAAEAGGLMSYGRTKRTTTGASHISWTES
jgi:hypothetical protein